MALKLPKSFHPDFSRPGVKPTGRVEIDDTALAEAYLFGGIVSSRGATPNLIAGTPTFYANRLDVRSDNAVRLPAAVTCAKDATFIVDFEFPPTSPTWAPIFTQEFKYLAGSGVGLICKTTTALNLFCGSSETSVTLVDGYLGKRLVAVVVVRSGVSVDVYMSDGAFATRAITLTNLSTDVVLGGRHGNDGTGIADSKANVDIHAFIALQRAVSATEARQLARDPYQILKPAQPMMLFTSAGGVGGTTYDVYASFAFTHGLSQSGSAQAQGGITLSSAVSCDDSATGDYNADTTLSNALTVSNSGLSQAQATAALAASLGYSVDGIIAFFVDVSFATSHSGTFSGTAAGQGAISLNASLDQTVSSIAQTIASVIFNTSHGLQNTTGQTIDGAISLGVSAGFQTLGAFTISGNITLNASLSAQLNASAQANANLNLGAQIGLSVLAQAAAQAGITLSQVVSVVHTGTSTVFGITTPDGRIYTVEIDTRTLTIEAEDRTYTVN